MKTLFLKHITLLICTIAVIFSAAFCSAELQILDTYDNCPDGNINDGIANAGRQDGTLAPLDYAGDGNSTSTVYVGTDFAELTEGFQIRGHNACYISPNHNFNDMGKDFTVEIDAKINLNGSWAGFSFNIGAEDQHEVIDTLGGPLNGHVSGLSWWLDKTGNSTAPQLLTGGQNFVSPSHIFKNSEISNIRDEEVHLTALVHAESFGGLDKVTTALFVNGEPFVGDSTGVGAMYELNRAFTNVWIVLGEEGGLHDTTVTMDNFKVTKTAPRITESAWTNDASSSISSFKIYTHAVNIGHVGDVILNGVTFTGSGSGSTQTGTNWALLNYSNESNMGIVTEDNSSISGAGSNLVSDSAYSEVNSTLMLSGLTPGEDYTLTLFNNGTTNSAVDTFIIPSDSEAALNVVDQNQITGTVFRYDYIAPENGVFTMTFNNNNGSGDASDNWRLYAFSNEIKVGGDKPVLSARPTTINFNVIIGDSTNAEIIVRNLGGGTVSGIVTGISAPFSISTDWYSATSNAPYNLTATFSPTEEGSFTNTINFSGTGGSQDITLFGETVPECSLFIGFLTMAGLFIRRYYN